MFLFWFALMQNNFMFTNLTKWVNQHCSALEILKKKLRDMNATFKIFWTHLCSIHKNGLCSCCCQTKPNASSAILSVFAVEFPRKNQTQNRSMICIWRRPNSYYYGSSNLIGLGSLCTHWYDITDLYQDIIYNNSLMGKTTFAAEVQNQKGKIYFVLLLEM